MKFEVFEPNITNIKTQKKPTGWGNAIKRCFSSTKPELPYEIYSYISENKEEFFIVFCGSNNRYELRGKKVALNLGLQAMQTYLSKESFGCNPYNILQKLTDSWKKQISKEYWNKSLSDFEPFFMAIAGRPDKVLFVQYGGGYFITQTNNTPTIFSLNHKAYHVNGFTEKRRLYFEELRDTSHTNIPPAAVMIGPYNFQNPTIEKQVLEMFQEFVSKTEIEHFIDRNEGRTFCREPFKKIPNYSYRVAGYWIINEARNPRYTNTPQTQGCPYPKEASPNYTYTHSAAQVPPRNYPPQNQQDYGQRPPAFPTKSGSLFRKQQKQKQLEQYLQQLAEIKQDLQIKEQKLIQLQQMQKDILKQQENLATEHEKTLKWKESQQKYLESKRMLNQCPQD